MAARISAVNFFDVAHCADLAVSPAAVTAFPITNLQSSVRGDVWRSPSGLWPQVLSGTFGGNVRNIGVFGIWPADGSSLIGATERLRMWANTAKTNLVYDQTFAHFTFTGDNYASFLYGVQQWGADNADKTARLAPKLKWFQHVPAAAWELTVTNGGAVDKDYFESRRIWLGEYTEAPYNAQRGQAQSQWQSNSLNKRTLAGSAQRAQRANWREGRYDIHLETYAQRNAWMDLCSQADPGREILFSLFQEDSADTERLAREHTYLGSLKVLNPVVWQDETLHTLQIEVAET
jgi:hypothetical protein